MVRFIWVALVILLIFNVANAQELPSKAEVTAAMKQVNNSWIKRNPLPGNNQWARAAYFIGNIDFYKVYPKQEYFDYSIQWANNNFWMLNGGSTTRNADNQCVGQVYYDLYTMGEPTDFSKLEQISESIYRMVNSSKSNDWWWIDALFMAMPVFTRLGVFTGDEAYFEKMYLIYSDTKYTRKLYNSKENLWYRDESFAPPYTTPNKQDSYWSRGNGWVFAAHARVLQGLPEKNEHRQEYIETFRSMADALILRQRADGFWNVSLDDSLDFGGPETSGTAFFTYGLAWGINQGLLDSATYYPAMAKAWNGLTKVAVQPDGFLGYVQGVGSNPASSQPVTMQTTADFGVGAFLLAGSEVVKLAPGEMPVPSSFYVTSVKAVSGSRVEVEFSEPLDPKVGVSEGNYSIQGIRITSVTLENNGKRAVLGVDALQPGRYNLRVDNLKSTLGNRIEIGDVYDFSYWGNMKVSSSSYEVGTENKPESTLDFDFNTRWSANGIGEWILYDLGEMKKIGSVSLAFYKGNERKASFSISLSTDGISFKEVFNGTSNGKTNELEPFDFADSDARYVKITGFGNTVSLWNSITETRIHTIQTGISEPMSNSRALLITPNPYLGGDLHVYAPFKMETEYTILVSDLAGNLLIQKKGLPQNSGIIALNNLQLKKGLYIVCVEAQHGCYASKLSVW